MIFIGSWFVTFSVEILCCKQKTKTIYFPHCMILVEKQTILPLSCSLLRHVQKLLTPSSHYSYSSDTDLKCKILWPYYDIYYTFGRFHDAFVLFQNVLQCFCTTLVHVTALFNHLFRAFYDVFCTFLKVSIFFTCQYFHLSI